MSEMVGMDISSQSLVQYGKAAEALGLPSSKMHSVQGSLIGDAAERANLLKPEYFNFDIAAISMALHHVADPQARELPLHARTSRN